MEFEKAMKNVNVFESDLLVKKSNSREELLQLYDEMNDIRKEAFAAVVGFHQTVGSNSSPEQGEAVLSAFYKDLQITPM